MIANTTIAKDLKVICKRDDNFCLLSVRVSDDEFKAINRTEIGFHGEWNYIIAPTPKV
ncbi:hypothetical protein FACS1894122_04300 [Alphaproteobacteria bacterium]|nr:hypothetical protein FACS1894122_04300 [Alphaproteobacteria bacterium]